MDRTDPLAFLREHLRDLLAGVAATALIFGSLVGLLVGRVDLGLTLGVQADRVVIDSVAPGSPASREGYQAGMVVLSLNGVSLIQLPEPTPPLEAVPSVEPSPEASAAPSPPTASAASPDLTSPSPAGSGPSPSTATPVESASPSALVATTPPPVLPTATPVVIPVASDALATLLAEPIRSLEAIAPADLATFNPEGPYRMVYLGRDYLGELDRSGYLFVAGLLLLSIGGWLLATGRAGAVLQPLAVPVVTAAAVPLLSRPLEATWAPAAVSLAAIAVPFGIAPLGLALAQRLADPEGRGAARATAVGAASLAMLVGVARAWLPGPATDSGAEASALDLLWLLLAASAAVAPAVLVSVRPRSAQPAGGSGVLQANALAVAGVTPLASLATGISSLPLFLPLSAWLAAVAIANRWTVRPLARVAARASLQRDLVVAATEAERARVAAEIHDDALQELTLLVRRLDETGDTEGAELARTVSERLRAICGDLRLPVLDDLGVGPALDWLAERMERLAGGPVHLERSGDARLPADVELAFFRIAQEALGNAVKHGKPPITIRYQATSAGASLAVDDAGAGIAPAATEEAAQAGRFGILNMQQRAEQIGALLDIRPWPGGGTHVALEWRAK